MDEMAFFPFRNRNAECGIGTADEREKCGVQDVHVGFNLLFFPVGLRFGQKTKEYSKIQSYLRTDILLLFLR